MLVVTASLTAKPGKAGELADAFRRLLQPTLDEPGCIMFLVHVDRDDPARFFVYEQWVDEDALAFHRETLHYREIVLGEIFHLVADRDRRLLDLLG
ncbi:MAG: antibiotic biosynthesis monooxygenase [Actinobacteria bacterium]|nr:antibiotic biosynthesis monooxygenase [Actinomycetota bacterium]